MKALVVRLRDDGTREKALVTDWPEPAAPDSQSVLVKTIYSGITNGTERNDLIRGNYSRPDSHLPRGRGYQNVGRVISAGDGCKAFVVGDIIFSGTDHQEFVVVGEDTPAVRLPECVDPVEASLLGIAAIAARTCKNASLTDGSSALIAGAGLVGQFIGQILRASNVRVTMCDINPERLRLALKHGSGDESQDLTGADMDEVMADRQFDAVFDAAGVPGMENPLIARVRSGGQILFVAGRFDVTYNFNQAQFRELTIKHNSHFSQADLESALNLLASGKLAVRPFITKVVPADKAVGVYDTLRDRPGELFGTVFDWQ